MALSLGNITSRTSTSASFESIERDRNRVMRDNATKIQTQESFISLADAQEAGVSRRLNSLRSMLAATTQHIANSKLMKFNNARQGVLLADIRTEVARFEGEVATLGGASPLTKEEMADKFLDNMERLLNRREGGQYLLNPSNPSEKPVETGSLKANNPIVGDIATSSYTNTEESSVEIEVASDMSVRINPVHAGSAFIREFIAAAHTLKLNGADASYDARKNAGLREQDVMSIRVDTIRKEIDSSETINANTEASLLTSTSEVLKVNLAQVAAEFNDAVQSLLATFGLATRLVSVDNQIMTIASQSS